jgi:PAS domain-containing protein
MTSTTPEYQIDEKWQIIRANEAFCRTFHCSESGLIGRDARDLMRQDWRLDFRTYVARALVGVGDPGATLPMVAPCGLQGWYKHTLEPIMNDGRLAGYRATVLPHIVHHEAAAPKRWWDWRGQTPHLVWDFEVNLSERVAA